MRASSTIYGAMRRLRPWTAGCCLAVLLAALPCGPGLAPAAAAATAPVDLNSASLEEVLALPISPELAQNIVHYRDFVRFFANLYELMEVEGMTASDLARLKPLVSTMPPRETDAGMARLSESYRQVQRYLGEEGSSEGLADEYLDMMREPRNINDLDLFELMSFQNVSPVDAANILKARERLGAFENGRQLRGTEGLRYFSYRNLRDFVVYSDDEVAASRSTGVSGYLQTRYHESPFASGDDEISMFTKGLPRGIKYDVGAETPYKPGWFNKIRANGDYGFKAGLMTNREYGEQNFDETVKGYVAWTDRRFGPFKLKGLYLGNYRVAYGLGLVMDNTDFIQFRKTGYGFSKRLLGVSGDLSRSYEYSLTGAAVEGQVGPLDFSFFVSHDRKDGLLNADGTINRYVTMVPRPTAEWLEDRTVGGIATGLRRDAFEEDIIGGNVKFSLAPGTYLGVSGYEARYDRGFRPDVQTLVMADNLDLLTGRDSEIWNSYDSVEATSDTTFIEHKFRRVFGYEGQVVLGNTALQAEYAFVQDPRNGLQFPFDFFSKQNPDAYVVNAFTQWDNLHLLAIWRDYDLGFDNPYNRAFSNDSRYEMTLVDSPYRLNDDLYTWVESATPQPKPEKGLFLETRYRVSRQFTITGLQYDRWQRKADGADLSRYTLKAEYQPIFNLRLRVRHRYSSRSENDPQDVRTFRNWETRWQLITMLSNYNRLAFMYMTSNVMFPPRPRLSGTDVAGGGDPGVGSAGQPAHAFEVRYEHNWTPGLKTTWGSSVYDGFLWNFEGNEFVLIDGRGFRNWFKVESRVSERFLFQLKVTRDHNLPKTYVDVRRFGDPYADNPDALYVPKDDTIVRLQMDYTF